MNQAFVGEFYRFLPFARSALFKIIEVRRGADQALPIFFGLGGAAFQLLNLFGRKVAVDNIREQRRLFSTTERFLDGVAGQLGNTVTEAVESGPKEFSVIRKSHLGLSGFELVRRWRTHKWIDAAYYAISPATRVGIGSAYAAVAVICLWGMSIAYIRR